MFTGHLCPQEERTQLQQLQGFWGVCGVVSPEFWITSTQTGRDFLLLDRSVYYTSLTRRTPYLWKQPSACHQLTFLRWTPKQDYSRIWYKGGCQNYGPLLCPLNTRAQPKFCGLFCVLKLAGLLLPAALQAQPEPASSCRRAQARLFL